MNRVRQPFMTTRPSRILIVDCNPHVRRALHALLRDDPSVEVVGEARDGRHALSLIRTQHLDAIVVGVCTPRASGFEAAELIQRTFPTKHVILLSTDLDERTLQHAFRIHPWGLLVKDAGERLPVAIREVASGRKYFSPLVSRSWHRVLGHSRTPSVEPLPLTPRQREVLRLIAEGLATKQIADRLHVSLKTAETHRAQMMKRLGLHDVASVVRYAIRAGVATVDN